MTMLRTGGFERCSVCGREISAEESIRRTERGVPAIYAHVALNATGQRGHAECFIATGLAFVGEKFDLGKAGFYRQTLEAYLGEPLNAPPLPLLIDTTVTTPRPRISEEMLSELESDTDPHSFHGGVGMGVLIDEIRALQRDLLEARRNAFAEAAQYVADHHVGRDDDPHGVAGDIERELAAKAEDKILVNSGEISS